jgi:hypothetical protein
LWYLKSGMLHKTPWVCKIFLVITINLLGNKAQDHEVYSLSLWLNICFIITWNPLVWLLKLRLQMKIYLPRMHNIDMFLQFCKNNQWEFHKLWKCSNQQEFQNLLRWTYCHRFHGQWP